MPAPILTPEQALTDYELAVSQIDLDDAEDRVYALTGYTLAEHVDVRSVSVGNVRRAWAIVAGRVRLRTTGDHARSVTNESDEGYSYGESVTLKAAHSLGLLAGEPNELLGLGDATWESISGTGHRLPPEYDDYGVPFFTV